MINFFATLLSVSFTFASLFNFSKPSIPPLVIPPPQIQRTKILIPTIIIPSNIIPSTTPTPVVSLPVLTPTQIVPTGLPPITDIKSYIMQTINDFRKSKGLSSVATDSYTCGFAQVRAQEISTNFSHDGFYNRVNTKSLPYPSYSEVTENLAMTNNYQEVVKLWINSPGHAANLLKDVPYACVENSGKYYAFEGWKP